MTVIAIALLSGATFGRLTSTNLGAYLSPAGSAYDACGPLNRLLVAAHDQPDLCGIDIEGAPPSPGRAATRIWTGRIFAAGGPGPAYYNYLMVKDDHLAPNPPPAEAYLVKRDHDWSLFRSSSSCRLTARPNSGL